MRLQQNSQKYATLLLEIGNGTITNNEKIPIEKFATFIPSTKELTEKVWPNIQNISQKSENWMSERAILAPLNTSVEKLNCSILAEVQTEVRLRFMIGI